MIETKGTFEELGKSFGGTALSVKVDDLENFYEKNSKNFTEAGHRSLLRAMGIPASFYQQRCSRPLQDNIFIEQKTHLKEKADEVHFLRSPDGILQFAASPGKLGWLDVHEELAINESTHWLSLRTDYDRGVVRWCFCPKKLEFDRYNAALMILEPIFYTRPIGFDLGMLKLKCTNGAVDRVNGGTVEMRPKEMTRMGVTAIGNAFREMTINFQNGYHVFAEWMIGQVADTKRAREIAADLLAAKSIPKGLHNKAQRHFDLLEANKPVDENTPKTITTLMDVFDVFTYHSQGLVSVPGQAFAEAGIFRYFYQLFPSNERKLSDQSIRTIVHRALNDAVDAADEEKEEEKVEANL